MSDLSRKALDALAPLRAFISTAAQNDAAESQYMAQMHVDALLDEAEKERDRILVEAADEGKRTAQVTAALRSARVRRQANEVVLSQREAIRQRLRTTVAQAATTLREKPEYASLRSRLVVQGRTLLGPAAKIVDVPEGGILVETVSRRLDLSLPTLAMGTLDEMAGELSALWTR